LQNIDLQNISRSIKLKIPTIIPKNLFSYFVNIPFFIDERV
jgi:hypothetical protein